MANPIIGKLTEEIENFKTNSGLAGPGSRPNLRFDKDAQYFLTFHIDGDLKILGNVTTLDNNNKDQFNMVANVGDYILKLRDRIKIDNALGDQHPLCQLLTNAANLVTQLKIEMNPDFHTQRSIEKLKLELDSLKDNLDPKYQRGLNNLLQQINVISQQPNAPHEKILADMMQQVLKAYYDIRTATSLTFSKSSATENPLGHALESFINQQMTDIGKEHGIIVPHVNHVFARGEAMPSLQLPTPPEQKQAVSI